VFFASPGAAGRRPGLGRPAGAGARGSLLQGAAAGGHHHRQAQAHPRGPGAARRAGRRPRRGARGRGGLAGQDGRSGGPQPRCPAAAPRQRPGGPRCGEVPNAPGQGQELGGQVPGGHRQAQGAPKGEPIPPGPAGQGSEGQDRAEPQRDHLRRRGKGAQGLPAQDSFEESAWSSPPAARPTPGSRTPI